MDGLSDSRRRREGNRQRLRCRRNRRPWHGRCRTRDRWTGGERAARMPERQSRPRQQHQQRQPQDRRAERPGRDPAKACRRPDALLRRPRRLRRQQCAGKLPRAPGSSAGTDRRFGQADLAGTTSAVLGRLPVDGLARAADERHSHDPRPIVPLGLLSLLLYLQPLRIQLAAAIHPCAHGVFFRTPTEIGCSGRIGARIGTSSARSDRARCLPVPSTTRRS